MQENSQAVNSLRLRDAVDAELDYILGLGTNDNLVLATANLGAYEALLHIIGSDDGGIPVYQALASVKTRYSTQSGILARLKAMRQLGLVEERQGPKRSQVCLVPSQKLLTDILPVLQRRYGDIG